MSTLIDAVMENFKALLPFTIIYSHQKGVKYNFGVAKRELGPGIYFRIPLFQ